MSNPILSLRSGAIWGVFTLGSSGLLGIINGALLARTLSTQDLGYFFIILPLVRLLSLIVSFGVPNGILKEIGIATDRKSWDAMRRVVRQSIVLLVLMSVAGLAIFMALWPVLAARVFNHQMPLLVGGVIFAIVALRAVEMVASSFFRAVGRTTLGLMMLGVPREFLFAVSLLIVWLSVGALQIGSALWLYLAVLLLIALLNAALIGRFYATHAGAVDGDESPEMRAFIALCIPVMMQGSIGFLLGNADIWCLGLFRAPEEVAVYGAVVRLNIIIDFVLTVVGLILPPMVAALYSKRQIRKLTLLMRTSASWSFLAAVAIVLVYFLMGAWLMRTVFGPEFEDGWKILLILSIGRAINSGGGNSAIVLQMTGFHRLLMTITMISAGLNLIANVLVVQPYGPLGVATVTALGTLFQNAVMVYFAYRETGVMTLPSVRLLSPRHLMRLLPRIPRPRSVG